MSVHETTSTGIKAALAVLHVGVGHPALGFVSPSIMHAVLLRALCEAVCHPLQPTQGPSDGNITFADAAGAVISQGPVQGVSVGHVGRAVSFAAQGGTYGLGTGSHTGAFLRPSLSDLQGPCQLPQDTHQVGSCLGC